MSHWIFIRSYRGDIEWLHWCLKSIAKFSSGFEGIRVVVPTYHVPLFRMENIPCEQCPVYPDDYLGQQITKLYADTYLPSDCMVTFVDSDCFFIQPFTPESLMVDGKPRMLMTPYSVLGNTVPWKQITERAIGGEITYEFMRRLPIMIRSTDLAGFRDWFRDLHQGVNVEQYVREQPYRAFSEFNAIGAWLHACRSDAYHWQDTESQPLPPLLLRQGWSHGGLTVQAKAEMEALLAS